MDRYARTASRRTGSELDLPEQVNCVRIQSDAEDAVNWRDGVLLRIPHAASRALEQIRGLRS